MSSETTHLILVMKPFDRLADKCFPIFLRPRTIRPRFSRVMIVNPSSISRSTHPRIHPHNLRNSNNNKLRTVATMRASYHSARAMTLRRTNSHTRAKDTAVSMALYKLAVPENSDRDGEKAVCS